MFKMKRVRLKKLCFETMTEEWWIYTINGYAYCLLRVVGSMD